MPVNDTNEISLLNINGTEYTIKDSLAQESIVEIFSAISTNNEQIGSRINDLNTRLSTIESTQYENVKPDWNAEPGSSAEILNKPTISSSGEQNVIEHIVFNNSELTPTQNKTVEIAETDPTVPNWAKSPTKPQYTAEEVGAATLSDVQTEVANLVDSAPETLNTLNELANALNNDENFATTVSTQIGQKYTKPGTGIPSTDLSDSVQSSLSKADTALQSFTETDPTVPSYVKSITQSNIDSWNAKLDSAPVTSVNGNVGDVNISIPQVNNSTVTITMNGATLTTFTLNDSSNVTIDLGTVITSHQSIKTVNNESLVGTGNIVIPGLPQVSSADNGKILMVVNGQWALVSPVTLYSGSGTPNNAQGNNGDIYVQS